MIEYIDNKVFYNGLEAEVLEENEDYIHIICEGKGYCIDKNKEEIK